MPDLAQSLQGRDVGHLRIVALLWGLDLNAPDTHIGLQRLEPLLLDAALLDEVLDALPDQARRAVLDLSRNEGRLPWSLFVRRYGALREIGPARRDRERPYEDASVSPTEILWYRAIIARGSFDTPHGPDEFAYIPDDLLLLIPPGVDAEIIPLGRLATPTEHTFAIPANDAILDDACTLLTGLRLGLKVEQINPLLFCGESSSFPIWSLALQGLLSAAGLVDEQQLPLPGPTRTFLEAGRGDALVMLLRAWLGSNDFDELRLLPGLSAEGEWQNTPLRARQAVLDFLSTLPGSPASGQTERPYWSLSSFIGAIRQTHPDFQRPAGDYDSWYLRDLASDQFLRGFEHWDAIDGALIRFIICGPLYWLGVLELASSVAPAPNTGFKITAFRFSHWATDLFDLKAPQDLKGEDEYLLARSDGRLRVPVQTQRAVRYQVARFCVWEGREREIFLYRLTPSSLERARQQGLRISHLLTLLNRHAQTVPPSLGNALERWETNGEEARFENLFVLRLKDPQVLQALRVSNVARFLGEPLGPTAIIVRAGALTKVLATLAEMGYLSEVVGEDNLENSSDG